MCFIALMERKENTNSSTKIFLRDIKKKGISFDIDGVDAWTNYAAIKRYNNLFGNKYQNI